MVVFTTRPSLASIVARIVQLGTTWPKLRAYQPSIGSSWPRCSVILSGPWILRAARPPAGC